MCIKGFGKGAIGTVIDVREDVFLLLWAPTIESPLATGTLGLRGVEDYFAPFDVDKFPKAGMWFVPEMLRDTQGALSLTEIGGISLLEGELP